MMSCPVCTERIAERSLKCKHCGAILNAKEAAKYGIYVAPPPAAPTKEKTK